MKLYRLSIYFNIALFILPINTFPQTEAIQQFKNIRYQYINQDTSSNENNPLIICVPGFTQHNASREFNTIKNFFKINYSFLIMNPPQHGKDYTWCKKLYSWGENEVKDLLELTTKLEVWDKHDEIHLLGFSIGAKIVLKFSAVSKNSAAIKSVIAVAAPYRVGDINIRLSGDMKIIQEGLLSSFYALKRAGLVRIPYMVFAGMHKALLVNKASPANEIPAIKAPALLLHGSDDWLTKSYHSVKLYERAKENQPFSLVVFNTQTHAEDMLSRDDAKISTAFLETLNDWFKFIREENNPNNKIQFNKNFNYKLKENSKIKNTLYPTGKISLMSSPTVNDLNTNIWISAADHNHSLFTVNSTFKFKGKNITRYFFTLGSTKFSGSIVDRIRVGLSLEQESFKHSSAYEGYFSLYYPLGSVLWLKRLTYIIGIGNSFNRQIISADLSYLVFDFQINYGKFIRENSDLQIVCNFPLVGDAAASYFFGVGYSRFLTSAPGALFTDNLKVYLFVGPQIPLFNTRIRLNLQFDRNGFYSERANNIWSAGVSLNFREK